MFYFLFLYDNCLFVATLGFFRAGPFQVRCLARTGEKIASAAMALRLHGYPYTDNNVDIAQL